MKLFPISCLVSNQTAPKLVTEVLSAIGSRKGNFSDMVCFGILHLGSVNHLTLQGWRSTSVTKIRK
jgi:hypothetical protein